MNIILFANGIRKRIIKETGGDSLSKLFDLFIGVDKIVKPWDYNQNFKDKIINGENYIEIYCSENLESLFRSNKINYALLVGFRDAYYLGTIKIIKILTKFKIRYGYFENRKDFNAIISEGKLEKYLINNNIKYYYEKLFRIPGQIRRLIVILWYKLFLNPPEHYFSSFDKHIDLIDSKTKIINIPHREIYFAINSPDKKTDFEYFVYLHQPISYFTKDIKHKYLVYDTITVGLKKIEETFSIKALICFHPNTESNEIEYFSKIFHSSQGNTASYSRDCSFIVGHYSISICYAYIFKKKAVLAIVDSLSNKFNNSVKVISALHKLPLIRFSKEKISISMLDYPFNNAAKKFLEMHKNHYKQYYDILKEAIYVKR